MMKWRQGAFALFFALGGAVLCIAAIALSVLVVRGIVNGQGFDFIAFLCALAGGGIGVISLGLSREAWRQRG
jgi:hypothetical protein